MTAIAYAHSDKNIIDRLLTLPLEASADVHALTQACTAFVSVLVETDDADAHAALCARLQQALGQLRPLCETFLSAQEMELMIAGEKAHSCVPDCWQDAEMQVDYALALTQAVAGGTLAPTQAKALTRLLHDLVWLLAEFVTEPRRAAH